MNTRVETATSETDDFQAYLDSLAMTAELTDSEATVGSSLHKFQSCLADVERLGRAKGSNIWESISLFPDMIQPIARIVCAVPSTQASVERIFSHLKLILRENRARMGADLADAILFLRTNKCV